MRRVLALTLVTLLTACGTEDRLPESPASADAVPGEQAQEASAEQLMAHIKVLASDEFEGRSPSSPGEEKTVAYLEEQFDAYGLLPGNGDSYRQRVPLVEITADPDISLTVENADVTEQLAYGEDVMVWTKRVVERASLDASDIVFVGYGIVAPEYDWNDYADVDVRGKTVLILVNDPGYATQDATLFNGNAMTYYGRWTYKYEEAARQGAAGALIVHEAEAAGYPWAVVSGSWSGAQFDLVTPDRNLSRVAVEGWITNSAAERLLAAAGINLEQARSAALQSDFEPVELPWRASVELRNGIRESTSHNVIAMLPGTERSDEYVVYMAHWDHLGRDTGLEGDQIYNGAVDNASGTASLLELARLHAQGPRSPRSLLFVAMTAEESGLLGSKYYAANPVVPLAATVGGINMDGLNVHGPTRDVAVIGYGASELDELLVEAATAQDRIVVPEPTPEKGYYYRSDHFNLAKQGVPMLYAESGVDYVDGGVTRGRRLAWEYTAMRYHKPGDEIQDNWDLSGAALDAMLYYTIGSRLANEPIYPNWYEGNEFRAIRDASLSAATR